MSGPPPEAASRRRGGARPLAHVAVIAALTGSLAACWPFTGDIVQPPGTPVDVAAPNCGEHGRVVRGQLQGGGRVAHCDTDAWTFTLPAQSPPERVRRTEVWLDRGGDHTYRSGDTATIAATVTGHLGAAATARGDWHVVWQLHGATSGTWKGPAMVVVVRQGNWVLAGGNGHAGHDVGGASYTWDRVLAPYRDGQPFTFKVVTRLGSGPDGVVDAWADGRQVVQDYRPRSPTGLYPGTIYPGQDTVVSRVGVYRGTLDEFSPPTYEQSVAIRVDELS